MSRVSHSVLSIPDAGDTVWNHVMSCTHLPAGGARECLTCGRNWINVAMRVLSAACDCCSSLWSKNCSFSVNFEITISLQSLFPIMLVSLTNMASFVFWMPELTSPHHHSKQIRRQHLGTRRSVPSCPVACHWILTCGLPHTHTYHLHPFPPRATVPQVVWKCPFRKKKNSLPPVPVASNKSGQSSRDHQKLMLFLYLPVSVMGLSRAQKALVCFLRLLGQ